MVIDWTLVGNIVASVILLVIAGGIGYLVWESCSSYEDDPGTGY